MRAVALAAALILAAFGARAQTYYGGYDIGPDYGAMVQDMQRQMEASRMQQQQAAVAIAQQAMQDPTCQGLYQQHRMQGGTMTPLDFGYWCAATGRFSAQGMAAFRQSEARNQAAEQRSLQGLRQAERDRGEAQGNLAEGYFRNQQEAGRVLQGNSSWVDQAGRQYALPYTRPGVPSYDPQTGQTFQMDNLGNYYVLNNGYWYPMTPAR